MTTASMARAVGTLGPEVAEFAECNLVFPEGEKQGEPFVLEDWQRADFDLMYETDERDLPMWKIVVWVIPTGSGKSPACGILANHALLQEDTPVVLCAAASRDQAGIVHGHAVAEAKGGPLDDYFEFPRVTSALGPVKCPSTGGVLRVLSADGALQEGKNPSLVVIDELHVFTTSKQIALYNALTTKLHKRAGSRLIVISTAGEDKDSLLGNLIDAIVKAGEVEYQRLGCKMIVRDYEAKRLLIYYGAPEEADIRDPQIWRACNPASWITDEALRLAALQEPESVFRRYHLNQWVKGEEAAIQPAAWDACEDASVEIPAGADIWVAVDLGEKRDTAAVVWGAPVGDRLVVRSRVFTAQQVSGMETTLPQVEACLRDLAGRYHVRRVDFDPWQMRDLAARLASEGLPMFECKQNNVVMVPASQLTFDLIGARQIAHDGDKTLRAHVLGTSGELTATGGWRFAKAKTKTGHRDLSKQNDACVALAMMVYGWNADSMEPEPVQAAIY
jgi:phage terminase large subunit-like protein